MTVSEEARERVADIVDLQPTKNAELQERWEMDSGSDVHGYLESELDEYYYRNEDSLICATPAAEQLVGDADADGPRVVSGTRLQRLVLDELPGPEGEPQSVVATLQAVRGTGNIETDADEVRSALHTLADKGLVERVERTVPTFRLAIGRERIELDID